MAGIKGTRGLTMLELLIVVSIIGILAATAIVNFLEAQTRAKITRAGLEQHQLILALEEYRIREGNYLPSNSVAAIPGSFSGWRGSGGPWLAPSNPAPPPYQDPLTRLTSPYPYMSYLPFDPFHRTSSGQPGPYGYVLFSSPVPRPDGGLTRYCLFSCGPSQGLDSQLNLSPPQFLVYSPTNGTTSSGDLWAFQP